MHGHGSDEGADPAAPPLAELIQQIRTTFGVNDDDPNDGQAKTQAFLDRTGATIDALFGAEDGGRDRTYASLIAYFESHTGDVETQWREYNAALASLQAAEATITPP